MWCSSQTSLSSQHESANIEQQGRSDNEANARSVGVGCVEYCTCLHHYVVKYNNVMKYFVVWVVYTTWINAPWKFIFSSSIVFLNISVYSRVQHAAQVFYYYVIYFIFQSVVKIAALSHTHIHTHKWRVKEYKVKDISRISTKSHDILLQLLNNFKILHMNITYL